MTTPGIAPAAVADTVDSGLGHTRTDGGVLAATIEAPPDSEPGGGDEVGFPPGTFIRQYEIIRSLGKGGMGRVFLARDTKLGRRVAMKFLTVRDPEHTQRFLAEARATARFSHENIVVIHEVDEHEAQPYMVLEYLEGWPLRNLMYGKRLAAGRAVELMVPAVRALTAAHEFQIVHRDLKPENIMLTRSGTIKVLDFGIAKALSTEADETTPPPGTPRVTGPVPSMAVSRASRLIGTLPYMSPEQFGMDAVDHRTDIWAIGIILWEMLAGGHPVNPLTPTSLAANAGDMNQPMPSIGKLATDIPQKLVRIVDRCLAKKKAERYDSAHELLDELETLLPRRGGRQLAADESPFPGLTAFQENDADRFFGRSHDVARATARLRDQPIVGVVGPSGVGKSSFVRAGVIPSLRASGETWEVLVLRPGRSPLSSLASALQPLFQSWSTGPLERLSEHESLVEQLRREPGYLGKLLRSLAAHNGGQILVYVDQFEELYTLVDDAEERLAFTACLAGVADDAGAPLRVLVSMRSDFLDRVGEDRRLVEELTRGLILLQPLGRDGLRAALTEPVEMLGYSYESPTLVDEMLNSLEATPGALPLLQFAATRLWEGRDPRRKMLTSASYEEMGGVSGALATHANDVIAGLSQSAQKLARAVLLRLVTPDRTRAIVEASELFELSPKHGEVQTLLDQLVQARLLVVQTRGDTEGASVELVHESLIQRWPTLQRWLDESQDDAVFVAELRVAATQWDAKGRPAGLLWRGEAAVEARQFRSRYRGEMPARDRAFLDSVFDLDTRAVRRKRRIVVGAFAFLVGLVGIGAIALVAIQGAQRQAVDEKDRAEQEAQRAKTAEGKIRDQLDVIEREKTAKEKFRAEATEKGVEVEKGREALAAKAIALQAALVRAEADREKAKAAAARAGRAASDEKQANARLERLLVKERKRAERLEKQRKKIITDLK